jgi:hypothetical protein
MKTKFAILQPDLHYLQTFPVGGRDYLLNYGKIPLVNPYDKKPHTMEEMVNGIIACDPVLELICSFQPRAGLRMADIVTRYITRVIPKQYVSDLPQGAEFEITSYSDPRRLFSRYA